MKTVIRVLSMMLIIFCLLIQIVSCSKKEDKKEIEPTPAVKPLEKEGLATLVSMIRPDMKFGCHMGYKMVNDWDVATKERMVITKEFNTVSIGIYQKSTQRVDGQWSFSGIDVPLDFANNLGKDVYFHPMFGQNLYNQDWLLEATYTDEQIRAYMDDRIQTLANKYAGRVTYLDVYNELIKNDWDDPSNPWKEAGTGAIYPTKLEHLFQQLGSRTENGFTWPIALEEAFVKCRAAFGPDVKLIYNEAYNVNADHTQSLGCIALYKAFIAQNLPIDGIGIQLHLNIGNRGKEDHLRVGAGGEQGPLDFDSFSLNMENLAAAGADIYVTEFDVTLLGNSSMEAQLKWQGEVYVEALERCLDQPACKQFKMWGVSDRYAWKGIEGAAMPWGANGDPKPAYYMMKEALIKRIDKK